MAGRTLRLDGLTRSTVKINVEMVLRFGRWLLAQKYAQSTIERYCGIARKLCVHIGNKSLSRVSPMDIGDFLTQTLRIAGPIVMSATSSGRFGASSISSI